jgi:hypothetical protein
MICVNPFFYHGASLDDPYDRLYEEVIGSGRVQIVNSGENVHEQHMSPRYFEHYLFPFYEKRCVQLRRGGMHVHIDGYFNHLPDSGKSIYNGNPTRSAGNPGRA